MRILVNGVNTLNKGAELMFYAILKELEIKCPKSVVVYNSCEAPDGYFQTFLKIVTPFWNKPFMYKSRLWGALRILTRNIIKPSKLRYKNIDILFDASGFSYYDNPATIGLEVYSYRHFLKYYSAQGTKIVFLPQAFGPFTYDNSKKIIREICKYSDIVIAREQESYNHVLEATNESRKVWKYPDFTNKVKGNVPLSYAEKKGYITIIPNLRMVDRGTCKKEEYIQFLSHIIELIKKKGREVYILNHEGKKDQELCEIIAKKCNVKSVSGLNGLEVKGFISKSYMTISSRYHGAISSLNTGVPCLSTSWSHKYELLFNEYGLDNCILHIEDMYECEKKILTMLNRENHDKIQAQLLVKVKENMRKTDEMWGKIWETIANK